MRFNDFSGGLWISEGADFAMPANALVTADNVEYLPTLGVRGRKGSRKCNAVAMSGSIISQWRHYPRNGNPALIVDVNEADGVNTYELQGDGSKVLVAGSSDFRRNRPFFTVNWPAKNASYRSNGFDSLLRYDPAGGLSVVTASGSSGVAIPSGPFLTLHNSRLWMTDDDGFSVYGSAVADPTTWPTNGQLSLNENQGGAPTGLESFSGLLVMMKSTGLFRFVGDIDAPGELVLYSDRGCVAPETVAVTPFGIIYLSDDGLFLTDGVSPESLELSRAIRPLFVARGRNRAYPNAVGAWTSRDQYRLMLDPSRDTDVYVLTRQPGVETVNWIWAKYTGQSQSSIAVWSSEKDKGEITAGSEDGFIRFVDDGIDDDGTDYAIKIRTASRLIDPEERVARAFRTTRLSRASSSATGRLYYDNEQTSTVSF